MNAISTDTMIRSFDDIHGNEVAAEIGLDLMAVRAEMHKVRLIVDANCFPDHPAWIDPATARALAAHLIALADEADARNG